VVFPYQFFGKTYQPAGRVTVDGPTSFLSLSNPYTLALVGLANITGSPLGTRTTRVIWQPRQASNTASQIVLEGLGSFAMLHIGGWGFAQEVEQSLKDLVYPVHGLVTSASLASLAQINPIPAVTAAMVVVMSRLVVGSPSKTALSAPPTAIRIAPTPARVVFVFFILSGIIDMHRNRRKVSPSQR